MRLEEIVRPMPVEDFVADYFGRRMYVGHGGIRRLSQLHDLLGSFDPAALLNTWKPERVVAWFLDQKHRAKVVDGIEARKLYARGATIYFHIDSDVRIKQWHSKLCDELSILPFGQVSVLAALKGAGIREHFDANDNITIQLAGKKRWRVAENKEIAFPTKNYVPSCKIDPDLRSSTTLAVEELSGSDHNEVELVAGSVLHLPRGFWHSTQAEEGPSVSLNLLFPPFSWIDLVMRELRHKLLGSESWRKNAAGIVQGGETGRAAAIELQPLLDQMADDLSGLRAEDFIPRLKGDRGPLAVGVNSVVSKAVLARWRIHAQGERGLRVIVTSSCGAESLCFVPRDFYKIMEVLDAAGSPLRMSALRRSCGSAAGRRFDVVIRRLWYAGFLNISESRAQEVGE